MSRPALQAEGLEERLDRVERRLRDVQALTARVYEHGQQWRAGLQAIRAAPGYEDPWTESEPLVTVRIATYDQARILTERTLPSVQAQTYPNWEVRVVGDACTDDTGARIAALGDDRIHWENLPVRGPYPEDEVARWQIAGTGPANRGIATARGAWIAPLDHDDEFTPDHVEVLLAAARESHAEVVYGQYALRDEATGVSLEHIAGAWPATYGQFGFQTALHHGGLARFAYDPACRFADEPGDWNLARRWSEIGVRFHFVERVVTTVNYSPREPWSRAWREERLRSLGHGALIEPAGAPDTAVPEAVDELAELHSETERLRAELADSLAGLRALEGSVSWRVTAPLRAAKRLVGSARRGG